MWSRPARAADGDRLAAARAADRGDDVFEPSQVLRVDPGHRVGVVAVAGRLIPVSPAEELSANVLFDPFTIFQTSGGWQWTLACARADTGGMRRTAAAIGSSLFMALAPGTVAGLAPWWLTGWHGSAAWPPARVLGGALVLGGGVVRPWTSDKGRSP